MRGARLVGVICCLVPPVQLYAGVVVFVLCRFPSLRYACSAERWDRRICFVLFFVTRLSVWVGFDSRVQCTCWFTSVFELMLLRGI